MAVMVGYAGKVGIGTNTVAEVKEWSLDGPAFDMEETQAFLDTAKEYTPKLYGWSGSFTANFDKSDTNGQVALRTAALAGTVVALRLYVDGTNYWSGNAYVTPSYGASVDGMVTAQYAFQGTGALAWT